MPQLLGGEKPEQKQAVDVEQSRRLFELNERTRLLEERLKQVREKIQIVDETNLEKIKELKNSIDSINDELSSFRKEIDEIKEIIRRIAKDMSSTARVSDVKVLEKYINMIDFTRIVTKEEVLRLIKDEISKLKR